MHIRLATPDDLPAIVEISNWAAQHTAANFAIEPETLESWQHSYDQTHRMYPWLVAMENEMLLGFAKASPHRGRCAYAWSAEVTVYIHHEHRGRRVGTTLYQRLIPMLKAQEYTTLTAGITLPNPASQQLHEAFGFVHIGTFRRIGWKFNQWHDVGYWQAMLRESIDAPPAQVQPVAAVWDTAVQLA